MKKTTIDLWVGIFVAIGLLSVGFLSLKVANLTTTSSGDTYVLYAEFDNVGGLKIKAPVKAAGVVVGRVAGINLDSKTYRARVTMLINSKYTFSRDAGAEILTAGLLGEQYMGISEGGDSETLKNGDTITITSSALVLEQLIGKLLTSFSAKPATDKP